tara:strand:+ start:3204 stop:3605 length:402 start_codon:yes stop_codon:yes gene_type:complete
MESTTTNNIYTNSLYIKYIQPAIDVIMIFEPFFIFIGFFFVCASIIFLSSVRVKKIVLKLFQKQTTPKDFTDVVAALEEMSIKASKHIESNLILKTQNDLLIAGRKEDSKIIEDLKSHIESLELKIDKLIKAI